MLTFWAVALLVGSLTPVSFKAALHITSNHSFIHPAFHLASFAILAVLLTALASSPLQRCLTLLAAISFGSILELLEYLVYHQTLEFSDMRLDAYGAALGFLTYLWFIRRSHFATITTGPK